MKTKEQVKNTLLVVAFGVCLYFVLMNIEWVSAFFKRALGIISPLIYGGLAAAVLNVLMCGIERLLNKIPYKKGRLPERLVTAVSLVLSIAIIIGALTVVVILIIPQFASAVPIIKASFEKNWDNIAEFCKTIGLDSGKLKEYISDFKVTNLVGKVTDNLGTVFGTVVSAASSITGGVFMTVICAVCCIYILAGKRTLARQASKLLYSYAPKKAADNISYTVKLLNSTFKKFLSGQCLDALILGLLLFFTMLIFRLPYSGVICAMTAVLALIPYIGSFVSCTVGAFLILLVDPKKAIAFVVIFLVVQQVEGNLIYPRIVGGSVGLPALWTLLAVYVGEKLFGLIGMILFIPVFSVIYTLLSKDTSTRLEKKGISFDGGEIKAACEAGISAHDVPSAPEADSGAVSSENSEAGGSGVETADTSNKTKAQKSGQKSKKSLTKK